ncbi:MAG TPA: type IV pilus twitching motility protein PilT [Candidatus Eremiobacteraeota bacterium]|nr:MAG: Twitching mobility protein [bacterium ADurb.Bin363]HPZ08391.1 type IV pilus twitching motility protein PilT [Candidatus Eremiobacteraeota bacterium]
MEIVDLMKKALQVGASDLHLVVGVPPSIRLDGQIHFLDERELTPEDTHTLIYSILPSEKKERFETDWELNFSYSHPSVGRFRASIYYQKGWVEGAFRLIPLEVKTLVQLGLPPIVSNLALKPYGLVLITGPTGVGKSTTLNAMIDLINIQRRVRIITIEDPIEFVHHHKNSIVIQRELDSDTHSFHDALINALRQDPNVICVGEMRNLETISTALTAAETGHLVLSTLHTTDAATTVDRIVDIFPPYQQGQIRLQLSQSLQGIVSQQLLPRADGPGRIVALEILVASSAIRNLIREGKSNQIENVIATGKDYGMITMDNYLKNLCRKRIINKDLAASKAKNPLVFNEIRG